MSFFLFLFQVREDELPELEQHLGDSCVTDVKGGVENEYGKVNILLQTYISKASLESFSLISDMSYVAQVCGITHYFLAMIHLICYVYMFPDIKMCKSK